MHLSVNHAKSLEEGDVPVNPEQSPADLLVLSFTDSDLACMAQAYNALCLPEEEFFSLRLTSLAPLKHPLSIDLYIEQVAAHAKVIVVRLLGGHEWWKYGAQELASIARRKNIKLIMVPGDHRADPRLKTLSTVEEKLVDAVDACLGQGSAENAKRVLHCMRALAAGKAVNIPVPVMLSNGALYRSISATKTTLGNATVIFYRAHTLAADTAPIDALLTALAARGLQARAFMASSLKDIHALNALKADMKASPPDIILDATAFSAGTDGHPLANAAVPILQVALANATREAWADSARGLSTTDLAMHVVLPEADGRVFTRAISFKAEASRDAATEFTHMIHAPDATRIGYVADLAAACVTLGRKKPPAREVALVLSDYPDRAGRSAYAVGLDGPQSAVGILHLLKKAGYAIENIPSNGTAFIDALHGAKRKAYPLDAYLARFHALPPQNQKALTDIWGAPQKDAFFRAGAFHLPMLRTGNLTIALQPDRGSRLDRKTGYHDAATPPRHGYLAFYWWLRDVARIDAMIHLGTHGNVEWLPGKSVALGNGCWPEIALGPTPVIYPYIVSDPGEAAQAKRRIAAVVLSHLTPPLMPVDLSPELAELEALVDEFSSADGLDARRMKMLRAEILHRARLSGLPGNDDNTIMASLETHLCDIKQQRVGNGLHIFGQAPPAESLKIMAQALPSLRGKETYCTADAARWVASAPPRNDGGEIEATIPSKLCQLLIHSAANEAANLLAALDGKFIMPGSGGSLSRGRLDILPTGRNMVTIDPRMIPTPTANMLGKRSAEEFVRRYTQDHGDWPENIVIDAWGSATLRNGGDEIAQSLYLMGVEPVWDENSSRVTGFSIVPAEQLPWPRIDVSLRISGLFRDMFANLITLFDDAARAVAELEGRAHSWRIFGAAPGAYGAGVNHLIDTGAWQTRAELGQSYLNASHFAYGRHMDGQAQPAALIERIRASDALIHVQDQREMDVLSGADFADAEGGFAAAAELLGVKPALYHMDTSNPAAIKARTLAEEISLTLHARALGQGWIEGQMRHGYAGAGAFADVVDQLFAFAATTDAVSPAQFEAVFSAYVHDDTVRRFIAQENPQALQAMASRFDEAIRRGLWRPLRNSAWGLLDNLRAKNTTGAAA